MITTIIFDFGGVLGPDADDWNNFREIVDKIGLSLSELQEIWNKHWENIRIGKYDLCIAWKEISTKTKKRISAEDLENVYKENITIYKKAFVLVKKLKKRGYKLVLLSNESKTGMDTKIKKFSLNNIFNEIYCSAYLKMTKSNSLIFKFILKDLKESPENVVFIDDRRENLEVSRHIGVKSILYKNLNQLKRDLELILQFS